MFTSYPETLEYLYANLPIFQRVGAAAYKKDLTNTIRLCEVLGNPHLKFKSVHVAGTNGKGSTSHMLASVVQSQGYRTGLYTSPHLKDFTERIKVNGDSADKHFVVDFVNRIHPHIEEIQPSFFEITVAMAFDYFAMKEIDIAVVEVGLGGRLDSTNVITPEVSVITNIGWDHKDLLGGTLALIASEKAGIIKPEIPVVISERQPEIDAIFEEKARKTGSPIFFAQDIFSAVTREADGRVIADVSRNGFRVISDLDLPLQGYYQHKNLLGVLMTVEALNARGWHITPTSVEEGLRHVVANTGLKGRWQKLGDKPLTICDTGHNIDGIRAVISQISTQRFQKLHIVFGVVKDKDLAEVLELLPKDAFYYFCEAKIPRAMPAEQLAGLAQTRGLSGVVVADVNKAVETARASASAEDMIFIGGSTFVVAELNDL
jgi:folylpolyglutamate synthase/dihydrofolate synthase